LLAILSDCAQHVVAAVGFNHEPYREHKKVRDAARRLAIVGDEHFYGDICTAGNCGIASKKRRSATHYGGCQVQGVG
jgi:hypothetical protein